MLLTIFSLQEQIFSKYVIEFQKKSKIFNSLFADKGVLPSQFTLLTEKSLTNSCFSKRDILQIIWNSDSNKAYGHDMIIILMLRLCGDSICHTLEIIFKTCLRNGKFPLEREKASVVSIHKKGGKQTIKNYPWILLLPNDEKISECLLYDNFKILASINLFQLIIWGSKFLEYSLISPKGLTKHGIMNRFLRCVEMIFAAKWLIF